MKTRLAAAAATGVALSALLAGVPAGAEEAPLPLTVDPAEGTDAVFTVSGTDCVAEDGTPGAIDVYVDGQPLTNDDPANPDLAQPDGTWSIPISPEGAAPGPGTVLEITATCSVNDGADPPTAIVTYAPATYTVVGGETPTTPAPSPTTSAPATEVEVEVEAAAATPVVADPTYTG